MHSEMITEVKLIIISLPTMFCVMRILEIDSLRKFLVLYTVL